MLLVVCGLDIEGYLRFLGGRGGVVSHGSYLFRTSVSSEGIVYSLGLFGGGKNTVSPERDTCVGEKNRCVEADGVAVSSPGFDWKAVERHWPPPTLPLTLASLARSRAWLCGCR